MLSLPVFFFLLGLSSCFSDSHQVPCIVLLLSFGFVNGCSRVCVTNMLPCWLVSCHATSEGKRYGAGEKTIGIDCPCCRTRSSRASTQQRLPRCSRAQCKGARARGPLPSPFSSLVFEHTQNCLLSLPLICASIGCCCMGHRRFGLCIPLAVLDTGAIWSQTPGPWT